MLRQDVLAIFSDDRENVHDDQRSGRPSVDRWRFSAHSQRTSSWQQTIFTMSSLSIRLPTKSHQKSRSFLICRFSNWISYETIAYDETSVAVNFETETTMSLRQGDSKNCEISNELAVCAFDGRFKSAVKQLQNDLSALHYIRCKYFSFVWETPWTLFQHPWNFHHSISDGVSKSEFPFSVRFFLQRGDT